MSIATVEPGDGKKNEGMVDPLEYAKPEPVREYVTDTLFPEDITLRKKGWEIHSRPSVGEATWKKGNTVLPQSEALRG